MDAVAVEHLGATHVVKFRQTPESCVVDNNSSHYIGNWGTSLYIYHRFAADELVHRFRLRRIRMCRLDASR